MKKCPNCDNYFNMNGNLCLVCGYIPKKYKGKKRDKIMKSWKELNRDIFEEWWERKMR